MSSEEALGEVITMIVVFIIFYIFYQYGRKSVTKEVKTNGKDIQQGNKGEEKIL